MYKQFSFLIIAIFVFLGCTFGEYADEQDTTTSSSDGTYVKFTKKGLKDKILYRVFKIENKWTMGSYDFNGTNFKSKGLVNTNANQSGTYSITDKGYLKLTSLDTSWYVKGIKEDSDKISLLWTTNTKDLTKTSPTKDTYFFKTKAKADKFIEPKSQ